MLDGDVVQRIVSARQTGSTMQSIADALNAENIPTAQGGRQWWPSTVKGVLDRAT